MSDIRFYSRLSDHTLHLELWGASTKHPDCVFTYTREERRQEMCFQARWTQDVKFILKVASDMLWVQTAMELTQLAQAMYRQCIEADHPEYKGIGFDEWA